MAKRKNMNRHLSVNQITPGIQVKGATGNGGSQPPRNRIVAMAHIVSIAMYSPRKNSRNGGRLVSASAETKKTTNMGSSGSQNQLNSPHLPACASTIAERLSEPAQSSTVMKTKPIETS